MRPVQVLAWIGNAARGDGLGGGLVVALFAVPS